MHALHEGRLFHPLTLLSDSMDYLAGPKAGRKCNNVRVLICGKRGALCGKWLTFLRNTPYEHVK